MELVTAAMLNTHIRDNQTYLKAFLGLFDLTDPGGDKILFWDDSETKLDWLEPTTNLSIATTNLSVDGHKADHAGGGSDKLKYTRQIGWYIAGTLAVGVNKSSEIMYRGAAGTIVRWDAQTKTGPTDADLIYDVNIDGTTIWSTQANRAKVVDGNTDGTGTTFDDTSIVDGEIVTVDIDQVGATVAGASGTLLIEIECNPETD